MGDPRSSRLPRKGEVKRRGEPPIGGGIKAARATRLGRSTGSGTDAAGPTTWQPKRRDRCGGSRLFLRALDRQCEAGVRVEVEGLVCLLDQHAVVGRAHDRGSALVCRAREEGARRARVLLVEPGRGLVHEQELRSRRKGPRERNALPLPGREPRRGYVEIGCEADLDERLPCVAVGSAQIEPELDVLARGQVGDEAGFLRHERDVAAS